MNDEDYIRHVTKMFLDIKREAQEKLADKSPVTRECARLTLEACVNALRNINGGGMQ